MPLPHFIFFILSLFFLETALLPGLFTTETSLHISFLLLLAFLYQVRTQWLLGLFLFVLLLPFSMTQAPLLLSFIYAAHIAAAYFLTQSLLGARSFSSYLLYAGLMSCTFAISTAVLFQSTWQRAMMHFIFSFLFLFLVKTLFPLRTRSFLSTI